MRRKSGKWGNDKSKSGFGARRGPRVIWLGKDTSFGVAIYYLLTVSKKFKLSVVHAQDGTLRNEQRNLVGWQGFERGTGKCKTFCRSGSLGVFMPIVRLIRVVRVCIGLWVPEGVLIKHLPDVIPGLHTVRPSLLAAGHHLPSLLLSPHHYHRCI